MRGIEPSRSSSNPQSESAWVWLAVGLACVTLCFRLGSLPLLQPDEGRNAEVAREMKASGAWLVPTYNGVDYLDKPAFYFKAVAFSLAAFGDNETAARLPSALFGLALLASSYAFCRKIYGARCAVLAAIVIASLPLFVMNARTVIFDIALAFFVCGAIFAGFLAEETEGRTRRKWYLLGAASAGLATLVKGPVGFLVPALVLLVFNAVERRRGAWRRLLSPLNLLVFLALTLPWFVGLCLAHPDFLHYGLVEESFHRFTSARTFHRSQPFYFYLIVIAVMFFPWSVLLPEAGWATWRQRWAGKHRADRLCLVWAAVVVLFFSVSQSKLPGYILSVTVAIGLLTARLFDTALAYPAGRAARLAGRGALAFGVICLLVAVTAMAGMSQLYRLAGPLRLTAGSADRLGWLAVPFAVALAAFGVFGALAYYRRSPRLCFLCLALFLPLGANAGMGVIDEVFAANSGRQLARQLPALAPETPIACLSCFPNGVPFYLRRPLTLISDDGRELTSNYIVYALKKSAAWPEQIVPRPGFDAWLASRASPVYVIVRQRDREKLESLAAARGAAVQMLAAGYWGADLPAAGGH